MSTIVVKPTILIAFIFTSFICSPALSDFNDLWTPESSPSLLNEQELIEQGFSIAIPNPNRNQKELYVLENDAQFHKRGIWSTEKYKIKTPITITGHENSFQIIEGEIISTKLQKDKLYLNFGEDWKTDFTIAIPKSSLSKFKKANFNPKDWTGQYIQARGWIEQYNGAMMKVTNPVQIKLLHPLPNIVP